MKQQREKQLREEAREQSLIGPDLEANSAPLRPEQPIKLDR